MRLKFLVVQDDDREKQPWSQCLGSQRSQFFGVSSVDLLKVLVPRDLVRLCPTQWYDILVTGFQYFLASYNGKL